ncbi:hypothetical protein DID88_009800 [Monilinia fructigena]|uniref:diacylglycerol O-acyltransferase n=1 Tax=Monilinia fructigena TaxID=38457 RepID=A0A395IK43_9HELO|nr:hypothetical protein DID88_009800 [Monilinia fructigena]
MLENIRKYGVLICLKMSRLSKTRCYTRGRPLLYNSMPSFVAYVVELAAAQQARASLKRSNKRAGTATPGGSYIATEAEQEKFHSTWKIIAWIHGLNITLCLLITSVIVYFFIHHPLIGTITEAHAIIVWLKTYSYAFTCRDLRHAYLHPSSKEEDALPEIYNKCPYPQNITLNNLTYFWWVPTLVYQPVYILGHLRLGGFLLAKGWQRGWSSYSASVAVFTFSAVLHELMVGIPTHNIIGVAFIGMLAQLPLIAITAPLEKMNGINVGQPLAALLYFFAWQAKYGSVSKLTTK